MNIFQNDLPALKSMDTKKHIYLSVEGKEDNKHLVAVKKSFFGRAVMWLGLSNASMKNVAEYVGKQPYIFSHSTVMSVNKDEALAVAREEYFQNKGIAYESVKPIKEKIIRWNQNNPNDTRRINKSITNCISAFETKASEYLRFMLFNPVK